jgi:hypothetical protein
VGDLHPRRAGADHQHVPALIGARVSVYRRVHQFGGEAVRTRPLGNARGVLVSDGDNDLVCADTAGRRFKSPAGACPVDTRDFGTQPQLDPAFTGVPVEVIDDVVTGRKHGRALWVRPVR